MLSFQHIEFLLGLLAPILLCVLYFFVLKWKKKVKKQIGDEELVNALTNDYSKKNYNYKFILILTALAFCIVGAANIRKPAKGSTGNQVGIDIMIALDVSNSMLAQDVKPNRLERAKQVINGIIDKMGNNRMGMVVFAGQAFLQMPLTSDLAAAKLYVSSASPDAVPAQGTEIGDALKLCNTALDTKEKKHKAIILISDGEDHDQKTDAALKDLIDLGVVVYTIGIGSPDGAPIFDAAMNDFKKDENGNTVVSKLDEKDLQNIASKTGGEYYLFTSADVISNSLTTSIDKMEKKQIGGSGIRVYKLYYQWFLLATFVLLLLETVIPERKMKWFSWEK